MQLCNPPLQTYKEREYLTWNLESRRTQGATLRDKE
jgi:hypothetical protein